jgi:DegV family protein with EDD domain
MARTAVVTDSAACVPAQLLREYGIHVVPFELMWDGRSYRDGIDLTPTEFYRGLRERSSWPSTSQPALADFTALYSRLSREADGIVSIHVPGELSGTVHTARVAAEECSPAAVRVIDSRTAAIAQGFVVLAAGRAAAAGGSLEDVVAATEATIPRVGLFATLETLTYLRRGGRIGEAAALLASRLRIHPILELADGRVRVAGTAHRRGRALGRLLELTYERVDDQPASMSVFHADAGREAEQLSARVRSRFDCRELYVTEFTPVMGAHTGPGTIGLAFCTAERG